MTNTISTASPSDTIASMIAVDLRAAERSHDAALIDKLQLATAMLQSRAELNLGVEVGQQALEYFGKAIASDIEGRKLIAQTHRRLLMVAQAGGMDHTVMGGPGEQKPAPGDTENPYPKPTGMLEAAA